MTIQSYCYTLTNGMTSERLTPSNAKEFVGRICVFTSQGETRFCFIRNVSDSGKSIGINFPFLRNRLQLVSRCVLVLI
jgi:hypothetical protein